jgi:hypothetical protein
MPGIARQFEPHITRSGGAPSKYRFTVQCSQCRKVEAFEANRPGNDERVKGYFRERGWLLGRDQADDLCPSCLAKPRETQHLHSSNEARRSKLPERHPRRLVPSREQPSRDTADILARHLGKPEALAEEVFRPKPVQPPRPSAAPDAHPHPAPALPPKVEDALMRMAAELKDLRSTLQIMTEQVSKLVALGGQQIEAIGRLAPLVAQSADGISDGLRDVVSAVRSIPYSSPPVAQTEQQPMPPAEENVARGPAITSHSAALKIQEQGKHRRRRASKDDSLFKALQAGVTVKSIPDSKRPDRFYTSIRLPRELWDKAGFGPDDRLVLDWGGRTLAIRRVAEGGVKPKAIGATAAILQSWKLGNLNFNEPKVIVADASLRLTVEMPPT